MNPIAAAIGGLGASTGPRVIGAASTSARRMASVDKIKGDDNQVVTAARQPGVQPSAAASQVDRITDLIAAQPGIRTAEIAEALDIDADLVRPYLQPRIENSRIIVYKVPGLTGRLVNSYKINPRWTPADANFAPATTVPDEDDVDNWPAGPGRRASTKAPVAKRRAAAKPAAKRSVKKAVARPSKKAASAEMPVPAIDPVADPAAPEFFCAVFHDGRAEILAGGARVALTAEQAAAVALHLGRFIAPQHQ
jgi:hypothetical protein